MIRRYETETSFHNKARVKIPGGNHAYLNLLLETMDREYGQKEWIPVARRVGERGDIDRSAARGRGMWRSSDRRGACSAGCCSAAVHGEAGGRGRRRGRGSGKDTMTRRNCGRIQGWASHGRLIRPSIVLLGCYSMSLGLI
jgi:hypothetical protein